MIIIVFFYCRNIWSRILVNSPSKDHYTALLGVPKATRLDEGTYTCQVNNIFLFFISIVSIVLQQFIIIDTK